LQSCLGGLARREKALDAQFVKRNIVGRLEGGQCREEFELHSTLLHFNRQEGAIGASISVLALGRDFLTKPG